MKKITSVLLLGLLSVSAGSQAMEKHTYNASVSCSIKAPGDDVTCEEKEGVYYTGSKIIQEDGACFERSVELVEMRTEETLGNTVELPDLLTMKTPVDCPDNKG